MASVTKRRSIKGVDFVVNETGERRAVVIDLKRHGDIWEDFYDTLLAQQRKNDVRYSLGDARRRILGKP